MAILGSLPLLLNSAATLPALGIKNSPGCRRDFHVKMWGTSSPTDKLTGDLGNVIEAAQIGVRRPDRLTTGKSSPGNFGLLQQYLPLATERSAANEAHKSSYATPRRCPPFAERNVMERRPGSE